MYVGSQSGSSSWATYNPTLFALDPTTAPPGDRLKWFFPPNNGSGQEVVGAFDASPAIAIDGTIYAASDRAGTIAPRLYSLDPIDGAENWRAVLDGYNTQGTTSDNAPVIGADGSIFIKEINIQAYLSSGTPHYGMLHRFDASGASLDTMQLDWDFKDYHAAFEMPLSHMAINSAGQLVVATMTATSIKLVNTGTSGESWWPKWRANNFSTGSVQHNKWTTNVTPTLQIIALPVHSNGTLNFGLGLNGLGDSVGYGNYTQSGLPTVNHAFFWTNNSPSSPIVQLLPPWTGNTGNGWARAINDSRIIIGATETNIPSVGTVAGPVWWSTTPGSQPNALPVLYREGDAFAINGFGDIVGSCKNSAARWRACLWQNGSGVVDDLSSLLGSASTNASYAYGVGNGRHIVGKSEKTPTVYHAFRTQGLVAIATATDDLGTLSGTSSDFSEARSVNWEGSVTGTSVISANQTNAFRWVQTSKSTPIKSLGNLGGKYAIGLAINDHGQIVGASTTSPSSSVTRAFIYHSGVMVNLQSLLSSTQQTHWTLLSAESINNTGVVVGWGLYDAVGDGDNSQYRAFLLYPQ